jgi:ribosomal protein S27E
MRRAVILRFCGVEWVEDHREVDASFSVTLTVDGSREYDLDLCDSCQERLGIGQISPEFLMRYGTMNSVPEESARKSDRTFMCRYRNCSDPGPRTMQGRSAHESRKHGAVFKEPEAKPETIVAMAESFECPACGRTFSTQQGVSAHMQYHKPKKSMKCPECGRDCVNAQGLAAHIRAAHKDKIEA